MENLNFLEKLKKVVDTGEFNSDAAKKIIEIDKLADNKLKTMTKSNESIDDSNLSKSITERIKSAGIKTISEEDGIALNSEYEKKMQKLRDEDLKNKRVADSENFKNLIDNQLSILIEIENMVKLSVQDMLAFTGELKQRFYKEIEEQNPLIINLLTKINEINVKYNN